MKLFLFILLFLPGLAFAEETYQSCELVDRFDLFYQKHNLINTCNGHKTPKFLHKQSLIKSPKIDLLISSYKTDEHESLDLRVTLSLKDECETIKCVQELDIKKLILENEKYQKQVKSQLENQNIDLGDESLSFSGRVASIDLHPGTPLFNTAPTQERMEEAIFGDLYGTLDPSYGDNNPEQQMVYNETPVKDADVEDFEWDDDIFSDEEIATWEAEAAKEDKEQQEEEKKNPPEVIQPESGVQLGIVPPKPDFEEIIISETEIVRVPDDVKSYEQEPEVLPEAFTIEAGENIWSVTPYGKRNDEFNFYLENNGQKFDVSSNELEMLSGFNGMIENIRVDNNTVYFSVMGMDEMQLAGNVKKTYEPESSPEQEEQTIQVNQCINSLSDFVNNESNDEALTEFMAIQGKLTMHRLAWANINSDTPKEKLEENILKLIQEKYKDKYDELAVKFDSVPKRSRNFLAKALPIVKDILNEQAQIDDVNKEAFLLNIGDLKMLEIVAEYEAVKDNSYDAKMYKSEDISNSIINFATVINSSYQKSEHKLESDEDIIKNKNLLTHLLSEMEQSWRKQLFTIIYSACYEPEGLSCKQAFDSIHRDIEQDLDAIMAALMNNIISRSDENLMRDNKYEKLWLKVAH